jgi:predicted DNA-binding protein (MmcQ/YjbR family)
MVSIETVRKLALSFEGSEEQPHFEKPSFRVKKKIFATVDLKKKRACLKLSKINQSVFSAFDPSVIYPVPNAWGKKGWTFIELSKVRTGMFKDALTTSYCEAAPAKLAEKYNQELG